VAGIAAAQARVLITVTETFMGKRIPIVFAALTTMLPFAAPARDWQVDAAKSSLTFKGTYQGGPFEGKFGKFDAAIAMDDADVAKDRFDVKVQISSVDTQSSERNDTLRTPEFFDTVRFPQARFITESFGKGADGGLEAKGNLTIRDQTKPVTLKVKFVANGNSATLDVDTTLNRLEFGLGEGADWADIGKDVPVHAHLLLTAK
jgi:polyisoprenoid-binding protein YceI